MAKQQTSTNTFTVAKWVVSTDPVQGTHTTIQAAINAASADGGGTVWILDGTYTENLTLAADVNLVGSNLEGKLGQVTGLGVTSSLVEIVGNHTFSANSGIILYGLYFRATAGDILTITGSAGVLPVVGIENCFLDSSAGAGKCVVVNAPSSNAVLAILKSDLRSGTGPCLDLQENATGNSDLATIESAGTNAILVTGPGVSYTLGATNQVFGRLEIADAGSNIESLGNLFNPNGTDAAITFSAAGTFSSKEDFLNSSNGSGYFITGTGTFNYAGTILEGSAKDIDPAVTQGPFLMRPVATAAATAGAAVRGTASFDSADFSVADGFVSLVATTGFTWNNISASQALVSNNGYFCVSPGGALALSLPATSAVGDAIEVVLAGATSWSITQGAGQQIIVGTSTTTLGAGGSVASTGQGNAIRIVCRTANTLWVATPAFTGSLTVV